MKGAFATRNQAFTGVGDLFLDSILNCDCTFCWGKPVIPAVSEKIITRLEYRLRIDEEPPRDALHVLRMLARSADPLQASVFERFLSIDARAVKGIMRELRDEWLLPICGTRKPPYGYFVAGTAEQFLEWMRVTRSQAISELATAHKLFRTNFPELAGQQTFDFVGQVSHELKTAIQPEKEAA